MQKIGDITNTADSHGEFTNGNVAAGIPPTLLEAEWFNTVQREIIHVLLKAGMQPNKTNDAQLSEAIGQLVNQVNDNANSRLEKAQNGADILDKTTFVNNLGLRDTVNQAKRSVPDSRKINGKSLTENITLSSQDTWSQYATIGDNADLNHYTQPGIYLQHSNDYARRGLNYPLYDGVTYAGVLTVYPNAGFGVTQMYMRYNSTYLFTRALTDNASGWTEWEILITSGSLPRAMALKSQNGWWQCPDTGIIQQWMQGKYQYSEGEQIISFPRAFPNRVLSIYVSTKINNQKNPASANNWFQIMSWNTEKCQVFLQVPVSAVTDSTPFIFAIGD